MKRFWEFLTFFHNNKGYAQHMNIFFYVVLICYVFRILESWNSKIYVTSFPADIVFAGPWEPATPTRWLMERPS